MLQDSLGGTAYTVVCCNVSPIEASESETLSTLRFAERLKKVILTWLWDHRLVVCTPDRPAVVGMVISCRVLSSRKMITSPFHWKW